MEAPKIQITFKNVKAIHQPLIGAIQEAIPYGEVDYSYMAVKSLDPVQFFIVSTGAYELVKFFLAPLLDPVKEKWGHIVREYILPHQAITFVIRLKDEGWLIETDPPLEEHEHKSRILKTTERTLELIKVKGLKGSIDRVRIVAQKRGQFEVYGFLNNQAAYRFDVFANIVTRIDG